MLYECRWQVVKTLSIGCGGKEDTVYRITTDTSIVWGKIFCRQLTI